MAQSFEEFIHYLKIASTQQQIESVEELEEITNTLYTTNDLFSYILQIYESQDQEILKFIPLLPPIFKKYLSYFYKNHSDCESFIIVTTQSFFKYLAETNPDCLDYLTNMIIENDNVDHWFCKYLWSPLFTVMQEPAIIEKLFNKMKQIFEECSQNYQNSKLLQRGFLIFNILSCQKNGNLLDAVNFREFTVEFFLNYFTPENLENESLYQLTSYFIYDMTLNIKFWFDFYFAEERCLTLFFEFIRYISKFDKTNPLRSNNVTTLCTNIINNLSSLIKWILSADVNRYNEIRCQFIDSYFQTLLQNLINTAFVIEDSFPNDTYKIISHVCLIDIAHIIRFYGKFKGVDSLFISQYFEQLLQLTTIYSVLPDETQNQFIINPSVYYYSAYCKNVLSEYEPRSFSSELIIKLFKFNPQSTIQYLLESPPSLGLMYLIGLIAKEIKKIHKSQDSKLKEKFQEILAEEAFDQITNKIQELITSCDFEPDILILKSNSLLFLPEEQNKELFDISLKILNQSEDFDSESFSSELQFYFTIACRIVYCIVTFFDSSVIHEALEHHISIMIQYANYCLTEDAIKAICSYFTFSNDSFVKNAPMLFDLYLSIILKLSNNFLDDYQCLEAHEAKIVQKAFMYICEILKIPDVDINEQSFLEFLNYFMNGREQSLTDEMTDIMINIAHYAVKGYIEFLNIYFEFCKTKIQYNSELFVKPFIYLIYYHQESFLNWESRDEFIDFSIRTYYEILEIDTSSAEKEYDDSYYLSTLVCMFILTPSLLDDEVLNNLLQNSIEKLSQAEDCVLRYIFFNIITSIIHVSNIAVQNDIILFLMKFIIEGFVPRESEKKRYISAIVSTRQLYPNEIIEQIDKFLEIVNSVNSKYKISYCIKQDRIGINGDPPYGFDE